MPDREAPIPESLGRVRRQRDDRARDSAPCSFRANFGPLRWKPSITGIMRSMIMRS